jgi:phosphatidylglycerophosphatase A
MGVVRRTKDLLVKALASGLFLSYLPGKLLSRVSPRAKWTGAGFVGTVWGWVLLPLVPRGAAGFMAFYVVAAAAAVAISTEAEKAFQQHDDPRIVIDETVGFWAAAAFLPRTAPWLAAAFVLFRVFDSFKPPPIPVFERLPGGLGVVMDDVCAGVMANLLLQACSRLY